MKHDHATRLVLLALLATPLAAGGNIEGVNQVLEERWKSTSPADRRAVAVAQEPDSNTPVSASPGGVV